MVKWWCSVLSATGLVAAGHGIHLQASSWTDPAFSVPTQTMANTLACPNGIQSRLGGVVLLVHGTGSTGPETWDKSPYVLLLPDVNPGYDVCYVSLPGRSLGNAAVSAEYVAFNVQQLAAKSKTGKVFVIGHSQGAGLNIPWALDFFPSTQDLVSGFVGLNGDFHGSFLGGAHCFGLDVPKGHCTESIFQQAQESQYIRAQNIEGGSALVGTTSIFTAEDEIIEPEPFDSALIGAANILIQDRSACGPLHAVRHPEAPYDSGYFGLVLDALQHGGVACSTHFNNAYCLGFLNDTVKIDPQALGATLGENVAEAISNLTVQSPYLSVAEPPLPKYVCQHYPTLEFECSSETLQ